MKSLKKVLALALALTMVLGTMNFAFAAEVQNTAKADTLKTLGLFKGTEAGYELDKEFTRAEGATMVLRLYGLEDEAKASTVANPFSDVTGWAAPYVAYAYEKGIVKGTSATTYSPDARMSGAGYVTLVLRALGYVDAEPETAADLAVETGVLSVSEAVALATGDFVRDDMVSVSYKALAAKVKGTEKTLLTKLVEEGAVSEVVATVAYADAYVQPSITLDDLSTDADKAEYVVSGTATRLDAVTVNGEEVAVVDGEFEATVTLVEGENTITVSGEGAEDATLTVTYEDNDAPKVLETNPVGLKQIEIVFNEELDEDTAEDEVFYDADGGVKEVVLQSDNKTVLLTLTNEADQNDKVTVEIDGVEDLAGNIIEDVEVDVKMVDNIYPEVVEVDATGSRWMKVVYSEAVTATALDEDNYKVVDEDGDKAVSIKDVKYDGDNAVKIEFKSSIDAGDYVLTVKDIKDYADFKILPESLDFTVVEDKDAPTATIVKATTDKIVVEFNEEISTEKDEIAVQWKTSSKKVSFDKDLTEKQDGQYTFKIDTSVSNADKKVIPLSGATILIYDVEDYSGNEVDDDDAIEIELTKADLEIDSDRPEVVSVKQEEKNTFVITFSEDVTNLKRTNITVEDEDEDDVDVKSVNYKNTTTNSRNKVVVVLDSDDDLSGTFSVEIEKFKDTSYYENEMIPTTVEVELDDDGIRTNETYYSATVDYTGKAIYVQFPEKVDQDTAEDDDNYELRYNGEWHDVSSSADFELLDDDKTLKIDYDGITMPSAISDLRILKVEDEAGNVETRTVWIQFNTTTGNATGGATNLAVALSPTIKEVKYKSTTKVELVLDDTKGSVDEGTIDEDDFRFKNGNTIYDIDSVTKDGSKLVVVFDDELPTNPKDTVTFSIVDDNTRSVFGKEITLAGSPTIKDEVKPEIDVDSDDEYVVSAVYDATGTTGLTIEFTFSEDTRLFGQTTAVSGKTTDDGDDYKLFIKAFEVKVNGDTIDDDRAVSFDPSTNKLTLVYNDSKLQEIGRETPGEDVTIKFTKYSVPTYTIADIYDNVLDDFEIEVEID